MNMMARDTSTGNLRKLFHYLAVNDTRRKADLILGFGVFDMRVPDHCAFLYRSGYAPLILFSGGFGAGTGPLEEPEAVVFRQRALRAGVPEYSVLIEPLSTNTLENVLNSRALLADREIPHNRIILVAQPHRQRRVWLTCRRWIPGARLINNPPPSEYDWEVSLFGGSEAFHASMIGEVERIVKYGKSGDIERKALPRWTESLLVDCSDGSFHTDARSEGL